MVGTRHPTPSGSGMAERLACDLAAQGLVITSGMARGGDTASHRGAIAAKGKTIVRGIRHRTGSRSPGNVTNKRIPGARIR